ncbi:MAG: hypothetical protein ACRD9Q_04500 [Nitrososphaeraceae archaeon]
METLDHEKAKEKFAAYLAEIGGIKEIEISKSEDIRLLEETVNEILKIKIRLSQIEKVLSHILKQEKPKELQNIHNEINLAADINDINLDIQKAERKEHAEINALRNEIAIIERQLRLLEISAALRVELNDDLKRKRERVNDLIKSTSNTPGSMNQ